MILQTSAVALIRQQRYGGFVIMEYHLSGGCLIHRQDEAGADASVYDVAMKWFKTLWNAINKQPLIGDSLLASMVAVSAFFNLRAVWSLRPLAVDPLLAAVLVGLMIVPLAWRRIFPSAVLCITTSAVVALQVLDIPDGNFMVIVTSVAIFSAVAYGGSRKRSISIACMVAITVVQLYRLASSDGFVFLSDAALFYVTNVVWNLIIFLAVWWLGNTLCLSREQTSRLRDSTEQLVLQREENARRAVLDERVRIARELHDVLAHHVSVMGIQAGAARQVLKLYPEKALNSLSLIETSSRHAVAELYNLVGLLRDEERVESFTSQPGLRQLDKLVADMQASGLRVEVKTEGEKREIPQIVDLSAYRILEESLTNILKHAGATVATINIKYQNTMLLLDTTDNGHGNANDGRVPSGGKGLIGMRERVNILKGDFWAGNDPNGGFHVSARLPLGEQ